MRCKNVGTSFLGFVTIYPFDKQTDRQTDGRTYGQKELGNTVRCNICSRAVKTMIAVFHC